MSSKDLGKRIEALVALGKCIARDNEKLAAAVEYAEYKNKWFSKENSWNALMAIKNHFLDGDILKDWISHYSFKDDSLSKKIGLILAGNIPCVGFHDILTVFVSGHVSLIKFSDKDQVLSTFLIDQLVELYPEYKECFEIVDRLAGFDAVISTGSNNSARYFESYFGKYPNIIRKNRNAVAVLTGAESDKELRAFSNDVFNYYGLGCRNVSKIYIPEDFDKNRLLDILHERNKIVLHSKYKNNFDYNIALFMLNRDMYLNNGSIILKEDKNIASRIACLHYEYYTDETALNQHLQDQKDLIQCIACNKLALEMPQVKLGETQNPGIMDYADGVDTLQFLLDI